MTTALQRTASPEHLQNARLLVANDPELQDLFRKAKEEEDEEWLTDNLGIRLSARWGGRDFDTAMAVAAALSSEFFAEDNKGIVVVDPVTGKVLGNYGPEDVYQPAMVPRESGNMAVPLPRLRPEIEAALVARKLDSVREQTVLDFMLAKTPQTDLQKEDGDTRFDILTSVGRSRILSSIPGALQDILLHGSPFENIVNVRKDAPEDVGPGELVQTEVTHVISLCDLKTSNLRSSPLLRVLGAVLGEWSRVIGEMYMTRAEESGLLDMSQTDFTTLALSKHSALIAPVELALGFRKTTFKPVIAVPSWGPVVAVEAPSMTIMPDFSSIEVKQIEYLDRWAVRVALPMRVWWEAPNRFTGHNFPRPEEPAELL